MVGSQRTQHCPHAGAEFGDVVAHHTEARGGPEAQHFCDVADLAVLKNEVAQRLSGHRLQFLADRDVRPLHAHRRIGGGLDAQPEADVEEVRVGGPPFPHPRPADDGGESARVGMDELAIAPLLPCHPLDLLAVLIKPAQVVSPLLLLFTPTDAATAPEPAAERHRTEAHQSDDGEEPGLQCPGSREVHDEESSGDTDQQSRSGDHQQEIARFTLRQGQWSGDLHPDGRCDRDRCAFGTQESPLRHHRPPD